MRGYAYDNFQGTGVACTVLSSEILGRGNYLANFTVLTPMVNMVMSIESSNPSDYLTWSGKTYM